MSIPLSSSIHLARIPENSRTGILQALDLALTANPSLSRSKEAKIFAKTTKDLQEAMELSEVIKKTYGVTINPFQALDNSKEIFDLFLTARIRRMS